jgi:excisionase family DNA binding protein
MTITRMTPLRDLPELLRADEAAAWLGVSTWYVYELVKRNEIAHVRIGKKLVRIKRDGLVQRMVGAA